MPRALTLHQGPNPPQHTMMLQTETQVRNTAARYVRLGYKYIVGWNDVNGFGLLVIKCVAWKSAGDAPYINF